MALRNDRSGMTWRHLLIGTVILLSLISATTQLAVAHTGFRFYGFLRDANGHANGHYDFQFTLYDTSSMGTGNRIGNTIELQDIVVTNGDYSVALDFGTSVAGKYLEVAYRLRGTRDFLTIGPRVVVQSESFGLYNPIPKELSTSPISVGDGFNAIVDGVKEGGGDLAEWFKDRGSTLDHSVRTEIGRGVKWLKEESGIYSYIIDRSLRFFMDPPTIYWVEAKCQMKSKAPIYYVNGMLTELSKALNEAHWLSCKAGRPVGLIYNRSQAEGGGYLPGHTGTPQAVDDLSEAIYDRLWPFTLGTGAHLGGEETIAAIVSLGSSVDKIPISGTSLGIPFVQLNPTTRQVTYLIYHADSPITLVSHSQGNLIVRNAIFTAGFLGDEEWLRRDQNVTWVGTGVPLSNHEFWPIAPDDLRNHDDDCIGSIVGIRGNVSGCSWQSHDFVGGNYVTEITAPGSVLAANPAGGEFALTATTCVDGLASSRCPGGQRSFLTIGQAVFTTEPGGVVVIQSGIYREALWIAKKVTLEAAGGTVTIDKSLPPEPGFGLVPSDTPVLDVATVSRLELESTIDGDQPPKQYLAITDAGASTAELRWSASTDAAWLNLLAGEGVQSAALEMSAVEGIAPAVVEMVVNPAGLSAGTYQGQVTVTADGVQGSPWTHNVTLVVTPAETSGPSVLQIYPASLQFSATVGSAIPVTGSLALNSSAESTLGWTASTLTSWLQLSASQGEMPARLTVTADTNRLSAGTYNGEIQVNAGAQSAAIPVSLIIQPADAQPVLQTTPTSLSFTATAGGNNPANQTITINNVGTGTLNWATDESVSWLTLSETSGTAPSTITVSININGLSPGTYTVTLLIRTGNQTVPITVQLTVNSGDTQMGRDVFLPLITR